MAASTLLYGPQGSQKTQIASQLARHLGLHLVIDADLDDRTSWPAQGVLVIATDPEFVPGFTGRQIHVNEARRQLGLPSL